ncbi:CPBP family intramembrane metalloprotease [Methanococcoides orientis]|uniref:MmRce1 family CPBP family CAAX prenyl protease n=1 Tax=Methanococcoides orientis TaxID=2822137 RepID=UPI001E49930C|nr:MmRce1 family CPBP family CAAX prenyl protease [Methanococcoides orientis]UGV41715.1 CPBP family intramembrane metalloprotease [Methanococcoides orientis]
MIPNYNYKPGIYYLSTFIITYALWFAGAYVSFQDGGDGLYMLLMLPGLMAPFLISLVMIFRSKNADLKKDFVNRLINIRLIQPKVLPVFILIMPLSVLVSIFISLLFGGSVSQFQLAEGFSFSTGFVPVLLLLLLAAGFEELGWRGYAFDSLQSRHTYFKASLIFSVLWSLWHFPLMFVNNSYQYEIFHESVWYGVNFFVSIVPMGMIISWICIKNGKSIIAAIAFHFIVNMSQEILDISQTTKCIETVVLIVVAAAIIAYDREMFFSREHLSDGAE